MAPRWQKSISKLAFESEEVVSAVDWGHTPELSPTMASPTPISFTRQLLGQATPSPHDWRGGQTTASQLYPVASSHRRRGYAQAGGRQIASTCVWFAFRWVRIFSTMPGFSKHAPIRAAPPRRIWSRCRSRKPARSVAPQSSRQGVRTESAFPVLPSWHASLPGPGWPVSPARGTRR